MWPFEISAQKNARWDMLFGMDSAVSLTGQLRLYANGFRELGNSIFDEILPRLRQIATWRLARSNCRASFSPNDLVNETWLTRLHRGNWTIENREHFFGIAGHAMQQVLIDLARKQMTERRGGGAVHISLQDLSPSREPAEANAEQVIAIGILIDKLAQEDTLAAQIVRERYLMGSELQEIAEQTGIPLRTVRYRWEKGRIWLASRLVPACELTVPGQDRE